MAKINYDKVKEVNKGMSATKNKEYDLIVVVINKGFSDYVVDAAREAGATGATIINARGTGVHENDSILGIKIQPEKEIILILVNRLKRNEIMKKVCEASNLNSEGKGLCFSMPVSDIAGISHLINTKKKLRTRKK